MLSDFMFYSLVWIAAVVPAAAVCRNEGGWLHGFVGYACGTVLAFMVIGIALAEGPIPGVPLSTIEGEGLALAVFGPAIGIVFANRRRNRKAKNT